MFIRFIGELGDDIDGDWARAFGVASEGGRIGDPVADRIKFIAEFLALKKTYKKLSAPEQGLRKVAYGVIGAKQAANVTLSFAAVARGREAEASKWGKRNTWFDGFALGAFGISDVAKNPVISHTWRAAGYVTTVAGIIPGGLAIGGYFNQAFGELSNAGIQPDGEVLQAQTNDKIMANFLEE